MGRVGQRTYARPQTLIRLPPHFRKPTIASIGNCRPVAQASSSKGISYNVVLHPFVTGFQPLVTVGAARNAQNTSLTEPFFLSFVYVCRCRTGGAKNPIGAHTTCKGDELWTRNTTG